MQSLWDFAGDIYQHEPVKAQCLYLQQTAGVDVCLLLTMVWAGRGGCRMDADLLSELHTLSSPWQAQLLMPLRDVRIAMGPAQGSATVDIEPEQREAIYQQLKALELDIEYRQLTQLQQCFFVRNLLEADLAMPPVDAALQAIIGDNVQLYLQSLNAQPQRELDQPTIARAAALFCEFLL